MKIREITESTGSGGIATIATPIGATQRRSGDMFFFGQPTNASDPCPNTPDWMKKGKKKKNARWSTKSSSRF